MSLLLISRLRQILILIPNCHPPHIKLTLRLIIQIACTSIFLENNSAAFGDFVEVQIISIRYWLVFEIEVLEGRICIFQLSFILILLGFSILVKFKQSLLPNIILCCGFGLIPLLVIFAVLDWIHADEVDCTSRGSIWNLFLQFGVVR